MNLRKQETKPGQFNRNQKPKTKQNIDEKPISSRLAFFIFTTLLRWRYSNTIVGSVSERVRARATRARGVTKMNAAQMTGMRMTHASMIPATKTAREMALTSHKLSKDGNRATTQDGRIWTWIGNEWRG